jgi:hypothetical protein
MADWEYRCYADASPDPWRAWFDARNERDRAKHDSVFNILEQQPRAGWRRPYAAKLSGKGPEIWEVIITTNVAWRIFGYFSGEHEFTVTGIGNHKGDDYTPSNIIQKSRDRRSQIELGNLEAKSCVRPETP